MNLPHSYYLLPILLEHGNGCLEGAELPHLCLTSPCALTYVVEINYKLQPLVTGQAGLQETCEVLMKLQVAADYCRLQDLGIPLSYHFNPWHLLCLLTLKTCSGYE